MSPVVRVVLADDHTLVRAGFRALLESMAGVEVVAEADDGRAALEALQEHEPDVLVVDLTMPDMNGLEVVHRARRRHPGTRVLVLSMHREPEYVTRALQEGARGYLVKGAGEGELQVAIRAVARGETYLSPGMTNPGSGGAPG
ncbi:MAG TPA: response regulator transcription factor, partial [Longimicrobiales bacterium]|nr:response regulator transcription factor [Longimicrobiales bacterium]